MNRIIVSVIGGFLLLGTGACSKPSDRLEFDKRQTMDFPKVSPEEIRKGMNQNKKPEDNRKEQRHDSL